MKRLIPFSNGAEAMRWLFNNCDSCSTKCHYKRNIEDGFILGDITIKTAIFVGNTKQNDKYVTLNDTCSYKDKYFSHKKIKESTEQSLF